MQTQKGTVGRGLVKSEFQACVKYLIVPLIMKDVERRKAAGETTFSGLSMHDVVDQWRRKLNSSFECLKQKIWQSGTVKSARAALKKAEENRESEQEKMQSFKSKADYRRAKATCLGCSKQVEVVSAQVVELRSRIARAMAQWISPAAVTQVYSGACEEMRMKDEAARAAYDKAEKELTKLETDREKALAHAIEAVSNAEKALTNELEAYRPSREPFFLTWDNCPSYSVFTDTDQKVTRPGIPVLQVRPHTDKAAEIL